MMASNRWLSTRSKPCGIESACSATIPSSERTSISSAADSCSGLTTRARRSMILGSYERPGVTTSYQCHERKGALCFFLPRNVHPVNKHSVGDKYNIPETTESGNLRVGRFRDSLRHLDKTVTPYDAKAKCLRGIGVPSIGGQKAYFRGRHIEPRTHQPVDGRMRLVDLHFFDRQDGVEQISYTRVLGSRCEHGRRSVGEDGKLHSS